MASLTAQREQTAALDDAHIDLLTTTAYSVANVRAMEQPLLAKGVPLMRMAARATAHKILQIIEDAPLDPHDIRVSVLVGAGDNGADGLFTGAMLAAQGVNMNRGSSLSCSPAATFGRLIRVHAFPAYPPDSPRERPGNDLRRPFATPNAPISSLMQ